MSSHNNATALRFEHSPALSCSLLTCRQEFFTFDVKDKSKFHPRTAHEGPEAEQRYSSTLPSTSALDGAGGQRHAPAVLPPGKTRYPLYRRLGVPQGRSGLVRKISPQPGFDPPDLPARSESL